MGEKSLDFGDFSPENSLKHAGTATADAPTAVETKPDFSGWATKYNLECSDGRTIMPDAFKHQDRVKVPLVWQHGHEDIDNVLGHMILEHRDGEGVYGYGYFNATDNAQVAKEAVEHQDLSYISIFANQLKETAKKVKHGLIREASLVLAGANPGALIDNISLRHSDGELVEIDDEAIIYTDETLKHGDEAGKGPEDEESAGGSGDEEDGKTVQDVYAEMPEEHKHVVHMMVGAALEANAAASSDDDDNDDTVAHSATGDNNGEGARTMKRNVFEQQNGGEGSGASSTGHTLTHDDLEGIKQSAMRTGSLKQAVEDYALQHGIENIDVLFPDARTVTQTPEFDARRVEWVRSVLNGTKHSPFSRIKSIVADITHDEARAKGYIKGNLKKEEFFGLTKRVTTPSTIYKKQQLDRDDIIDITDFDVVMWLKGEMRLMLDEELGGAILIGDGRAIDDEDKIKDPAGALEGAGIRSILNDHDLYAATVNVNIDDANSSPSEIVDAILLQMGKYKGSGSPTLYTTLGRLTQLLLAKDTLGRRLYRTKSDLAAELQVADIVTVEVMEREEDLIGIIVNLTDYTIGSDRGGDVAFFDDFDIDYNQYKYLIETRVSGALTKIRSALVVKKVDAAAVLRVPEEPTFDGTDILIPTNANIDYFRADTGAPVADGSTITLGAGESLTITATPAAGSYFANNVDDTWTYTNNA